MIPLPKVGCSAEFLEAGTGDPLLFLHGGGGLADDWAPLAARLQHRFRVIMVYLPGHGPSKLFDYTGIDVRRFASGFIDELMNELGIASASIVANSIGAYCALSFALDHPERARRLVLAGAPGGFETRVPVFFQLLASPLVGSVLNRLARFSTRSQIRQAFSRFAVADVAKVPDTYFDLVWAAFRLPGHLASYRTMGRRLVGNMHDVRQNMGAVRSPVLLLWGDRDCFGEPVHAEEACRSNAQCVLKVLTAAGHLPWFDCPDLVAGLLDEYLSL